MNVTTFLAVAANDWTPHQMGQIVGCGLLVLGAGAGLAKCVSIMRRRTTSKLCVLSLMALLLAWCAGGVWSAFLILGPPLPQGAQFLILLVTLPLLVAALVLGLIGLVEYKSEVLNQGRKQAVWAMVLAVLGLCGSTVHLGAWLSSQAQSNGNAVAVGKPGEEAVREDLNFALKPPDATWVPVAPDAVNTDGAVAYRREEKGLHATVVAEEVLALTQEGLEPMVRNVKRYIAKDKEVREQKQESRVVGGLTFARIQSHVVDGSKNAESQMEHWVTTHNGYAWQVVVWGKPEDKVVLAQQAEAMVRGFRVLDKQKVTPKRDRGVDVDRPEKGYSTRLSDLGWRSWILKEDGSNEPDALADLSVQSMAATFVVMTYHQEMTGAEPSLEALARAFLASYGYAYDRSSDEFSTRSVAGDIPGIEITAEGNLEEEPARCLFRVHRSGNDAWMIGGFVHQMKGVTLDRIRTACDAVSLTKPVVKPGEKRRRSAARAEAEAIFVNQLGMWYHHAKQPEESVRYFREAHRLRPENQTFFLNITHALEAKGEAAAAVKLLDEANDYHFATEMDVRKRHAWLRLKAGQVDKAMADLKRLIGDGFKDSDTVLEWINALLEEERTAEAKEVADVFARAHPGPKTRLWQAQAFHRDDPEADEPMKLLEKLIEDEPEYLQARYTLGEFANQKNDHERALKVAAELEKLGQNTTRLHLMRGWAHFGKRSYREARASFETAAKHDPDDEDVKAALQEVAQHLGQGSNQEIKSPIEGVPLPPRIANRLEDLRATPADFGEGHNTVLLLYSKAIRFTSQKPMKTTTRSLVRILTEQGAGNLSTLRHEYDPAFERLYVNRVEVTDAKGEVKTRVEVDDMYVMDSEDRSMADTDKTVHIQVAGLKPGDTVDYEITVERLNRRKEIPLQRHLFGDSSPTVLEVISISGEIDNIRQDTLNAGAMKITREGDAAVFEYDAPPVLEREAYAVSSQSWAPVLVLAPKGDTWEKVAKEHLEEIEDRLKPDAETAAEAKALTEGLESAREKARVLSAFVQKNIRYKAIEFGVRGYIPAPASQTLKQRYGDCKDQALLLHQMLAAVGVESHLAFVDTDWKLDLKQPTLDHFNHVIVHVPELPMPGFIDTTSAHDAAADHPPYGLWERLAFVLDPKKPRLVQIPLPTGAAARVSSKRKLSLLSPDSVRVEEELTLTGYYAAGMRGGFAQRAPKARFQYAQDILDDQGNFRLEQFEFQNLEEPNMPAVLRLTYTMPNAVEERGGVKKLRLPHAWETNYLRIAFIKDRVTQFHWQVPFSLQSEVLFDETLPLDPESLRAMMRESDSRFGHWQMDPNDKLQFKFAVTPGQYDAKEYGDFYTLWSSALDLWARELTLSRQ